MAKFFLKSGEFLWNAGIFVWNIDSILKAFENYLPDMAALFKEGKEAYNTPDESEFIRRAYTLCTNISIDYGIMEKAKMFMCSALNSDGVILAPGNLFMSSCHMMKMEMQLLVLMYCWIIHPIASSICRRINSQ